MKQLRPAFVIALLLTAASAFAPPNLWPNVIIDKRDYSGNIQTTDRAYFALGQNHPAIEHPASPPVLGVAYTRGSTVSMVVRWQNGNDFPLTGTLTWLDARLAVPAQDGSTESISLSVSNTSPQNVYLAVNGGTQQFSLSVSGLPNYVSLGSFQIKYNLPLTYQGITKQHGTNGGYSNWERVYLVNAAPVDLQSSLQLGWQIVPYLDPQEIR